MALVREWLIRVWGSLDAARSDKDLEEELRFHLDSATGEARRRSDGQEDAIRNARVRAGSIPHTLELLRDQRGLPWLDDATRDLRHTLRIFARARGFTAVAVLTLGLGIGASTAMFSVLNAVILRPLAYRDPEIPLRQLAPNPCHLLPAWASVVPFRRRPITNRPSQSMARGGS
jgi:hypothetical protein